MPTEDENFQYLYLILTHGGNPTVSAYNSTIDTDDHSMVINSAARSTGMPSVPLWTSRKAQCRSAGPGSRRI